MAYVFIMISRWDVEGRGVGGREVREIFKELRALCSMPVHNTNVFQNVLWIS